MSCPVGARRGRDPNRDKYCEGRAVEPLLEVEVVVAISRISWTSGSFEDLNAYSFGLCIAEWAFRVMCGKRDIFEVGQAHIEV